MNKEVAVIMDNGAHTIKIGWATDTDPQLIPNCTMKAKSERRRVFVGNQIVNCRDASGLFFQLPFTKGYLLDWDVQRTVWDYVFSKDGGNFNLKDRPIVITEPLLNFSHIEEAMVEILFEEYSCSGLHKTTTADLAAYNYATESEDNPLHSLNCIVVDVGYSFTHVAPFHNGKIIERAIRRVDVGGKLLTNHMKELISYRYLNMMDETYVVNQMKEDVCFVSQNYLKDVHRDTSKRSQYAVDYILPDFINVKRGYIRGTEKQHGITVTDDSERQFLRLANERIAIPELLFHPIDVGIDQAGIPEAINDCLKDCPSALHCDMLHNVIVIGGSSNFPGFIERLRHDTRAVITDDLDVSFIYPIKPTYYGWEGGREMANSDFFKDYLFTRQEYEENGFFASRKRAC